MTFRQVLKTQWDFLLFRRVEISTKQDFLPWLLYVLAVTWLVGVGRYWDHPSAEVWQYLGLGSVAYIFCLSGLLFLVVWPLRPSNWAYRDVLVFVGLTSLPAALYAVPIERFVDLGLARSINAWFLALVAAWRVALLLRYLNGYARLNWLLVVIVAIMMLSGIVVSLSLLNLQHVVFDIMAGIRAEDAEGASAHDTAYTVVLLLALISIVVFPIAFVAYLGAIWHRYRQRKGGEQ